MSSTAPYSAIERTLSVLLSPLNYASRMAWQEAAHRQLLDLTNADTLCIYAPLVGSQPAWYAPHFSSAQMIQYADRVAEAPDWDVIEGRFSELTERTGVQVAHELEFISARERARTPFHREFLAPNHLNDLTVANVALQDSANARLHFSNRSWRSSADNVARKQLVRAMLPAFRNGLAAWQQLGNQRAELAHVFDGLNDAMLLFDSDAKLVHVNRSAIALLSVRPHMSVRLSAQLKKEAEAVARRINALMMHASVGGPTIAPSMATREVPAPGGAMRVRGSLAPSWMFGRTHGVLVTIEQLAQAEPSDADIRARFGLTSREVEVAKHVAEGLSNQALAERMGVSFFTARNHVERVLGKMGAGSRAQVGAMMRAPAAGVAAA